MARHKVLADVNVCLDVLMDRSPHVEFSGRIFEEAESGNIELYISGLSFDTLFYIMRPAKGARKAIELLLLLRKHVKVGVLDERTIDDALHSGWSDLEDALQYQCAVHNKCNYLVTRNIRDFKTESGAVTIITPEAYIENLS